jgi:hypothetical protein
VKLIGSALVLAFVLISQGAAQTAKTADPKMAPLSQYLIPRDAEIALARSAAPQSISLDLHSLALDVWDVANVDDPALAFTDHF